MADQFTDFDHLDLSTVDPSRQPIPEDFYNFQLVSAQQREFSYKKGDRAGETGKLLKLKFVIVDDEKFSGRPVFMTLFEGNRAAKFLKRLEVVTGITKEADETTLAWLERMAASDPPAVFADRLRVVETDRENQFTGEPEKDNELDYYNLKPVAVAA